VERPCRGPVRSRPDGSAPPPPLPQAEDLILLDSTPDGPFGEDRIPVTPPSPNPPTEPVDDLDPDSRPALKATNLEPVALPDVFTTPKGTPLIVTAPGLLANDFDLDGDAFAWVSYSIPTGGTMSGTNSDGSFTYTPDPGFSGLEEINYAISVASGGIAFGTVLIMVIDDQNRPPVAVPDSFTTPEGAPLVVSAPGPLAKDFDLDGNPIEWISYTLPLNGAVTGTFSDGRFTYTPDPGFSGLEVIECTITDAKGGFASSRLSIFVVDDQNRPPVAVSDVLTTDPVAVPGAFTTPSDTALVVNAPGQLANDFDLDDDMVEWITYSLPMNGTVTGTTSEGGFVYTPKPGFNGFEDITYTVTDGSGAVASSRILIYVGDVPMPPPP